jgi:hypothetical protein
MSTSENEDREAPRVISSFIERAVAVSRKRREETSQGLAATQTASAASNFSGTTGHDAATSPGIIRVPTLQMTKDKAISVVEKLNAGSLTSFKLVSYKDWESRPGSTNRGSPAYRLFFIICHINTMKSAGWAVCPYFACGQCKIQSAVRKFDPKSGGTTLWSRHNDTHKTAAQRRHQNGISSSLGFKIGAPAKRAIAISATKSVYLDLRPFSYISERRMRALLETVFREGQRLPDGELPDFGDYIPSASTVASTLKQQAEEARLDGIVNVLPAAMKVGGGVCCDGLKKSEQVLRFLICL